MSIAASPPPARRNLGAALPWLLTSLLLALVPLAAELPAWVPLGFVGCAAWRQLIESRGWNLPGMGWRLGLFVAALGGVVGLGGRSSLDDPATLTALLVALISLKLLELRTARDFVLVALLGYFLVLSSFFYSQTLGQLLLAICAVVANTVALVRCHTTVAAAAATAATGSLPKDGAPFRSSQGTNAPPSRLWPATRLALALIAQALPLTALCFFLFPRLDSGWLRSLSRAHRVTTGMSEELEPGSVARLETSDLIAFRARLPNIAGELPPQALYWRGFAMGRGEGLHWRRSDFESRHGGAAVRTMRPPSSQPATAASGQTVVQQQITLVDTHGHDWLFALDRPTKATSGGYLQAVTGDLRSPRLVRSTVVYTVESQAAATAATAAPPASLAPEARATYLALPASAPLSPAVRALAESWRKDNNGGADDGREIASRGLRFFRDGGFAYSQSPGAYPARPGGSALDEFLFEKRRGFCEHYAAAFATLMRAAGLPARVVVGYQGGQWNPLGGHYTVRQSDAHAWTEVWLEGRGWTRFDPTAVVAPERVDFGAGSYAALQEARGGREGSRDEDAEFLARLREPTGWRWAARQAQLAWDTVEGQWDVWVVDYNESRQQEVFQRLGINSLGQRVSRQLRLAAGANGAGGDFAGGLGREWVAILGGGAVFGSVGVAVVLLVLTLRGLRWWRARRAEEPAVRLYQQFCARAMRAALDKEKDSPNSGLSLTPRAPAEGPLDFAARASRTLPGRAPEIANITGLYTALRYGSAASQTAPTIAQLRAAVRRFR